MPNARNLPGPIDGEAIASLRVPEWESWTQRWRTFLRRWGFWRQEELIGAIPPVPSRRGDVRFAPRWEGTVTVGAVRQAREAIRRLTPAGRAAATWTPRLRGGLGVFAAGEEIAPLGASDLFPEALRIFRYGIVPSWTGGLPGRAGDRQESTSQRLSSSGRTSSGLPAGVGSWVGASGRHSGGGLVGREFGPVWFGGERFVPRWGGGSEIDWGASLRRLWERIGSALGPPRGEPSTTAVEASVEEPRFQEPGDAPTVLAGRDEGFSGRPFVGVQAFAAAWEALRPLLRVPVGEGSGPGAAPGAGIAGVLGRRLVAGAAEVFSAWFRRFRPPTARDPESTASVVHVHVDRIELPGERGGGFEDGERWGRLLGEALRRERFLIGW